MGAPKGNTNGKGKRVWSDAIRKTIVQRKDLEKLAVVLVDQALAGDLQAMKEVGDRLEGKSQSGIDITLDESTTARPYTDLELAARIANLLVTGTAAGIGGSGEGEHEDMGTPPRATDGSIPH